MIGASMILIVLLGISTASVLPKNNVRDISELFLDDFTAEEEIDDDNEYMVLYDHMNLEKLPADLSKEIQILDATANKLSVIDNETLPSLPNLLYLYLGENFIHRISETAFASMDKLRVLHLNNNHLENFPHNIFELPRLEQFYLGGNLLTDAALKVEYFPENNSKMRILDLSHNKLTKFPAYLDLFRLETLDLSHNVIKAITVEELLPFPFLKELNLLGNPILSSDNFSNCHEFNEWIKLKNIKMNPSEIFCKYRLKDLLYFILNILGLKPFNFY